MIELSYRELAGRVRSRFGAVAVPEDAKIYGVPNGGIYAALLIAKERPKLSIVEVPIEADVIVDDIIDSGKTRDHWISLTDGQIPFFALVDKTGSDKAWAGKWVSFPWERARREDGPQDAIRRILQFIGEDVNREGLKETPDRVTRSYKELFAGYKQDPASVFKTFDDGACDEMVLLRNTELTSQCEHHMIPFFGVAHVAYIPNKRIIGISKLARLVDIFSRRLQVQERLTTQITGSLDEHLKPLGSACVIRAKHLCMHSRGVRKQNSEMITSSLTGVFRQPEVRAEFFNLIKGI